MEIKIYNSKGAEESKQIVNDAVFHIVLNKQATFSSVLAENASKQQGTHSTKTKAEVSGGGKKPWAQKGTGNARQGSTRNPQWRHGGVVFGPKPNKNYELKVNKKAHKLAMASVLSDKFISNAFKVISKFEFEKFSTKDAINFIEQFAKVNQKILIISKEFIPELSKSIANLPKVEFLLANKVSTRDIMHADFLILDQESVNYYNEVFQ